MLFFFSFQGTNMIGANFRAKWSQTITIDKKCYIHLKHWPVCKEETRIGLQSVLSIL